MTTQFYEDAAFLAWLAGRKPRDELIVRMALRNDIRDPATARAWNARIDELERDVIINETDMAEVMTAVRWASEEIERVMAQEDRTVANAPAKVFPAPGP